MKELIGLVACAFVLGVSLVIAFGAFALGFKLVDLIL